MLSTGTRVSGPSTSLQVRTRGPQVSTRIAQVFFFSSATFRTNATIGRISSMLMMAMLNRATSIPSSIMRPIISSVLLFGPMVAMIFVFRTGVLLWKSIGRSMMVERRLRVLATSMPCSRLRAVSGCMVPSLLISSSPGQLVMYIWRSAAASVPLAVTIVEKSTTTSLPATHSPAFCPKMIASCTASFILLMEDTGLSSIIV
mmetsp:Transcript_19516/g.46618  ORF Transcript_19516/g.46618 Transcript_19516/m.46618 type:complete len:202 (-) Transcript_19516:540-1145(-)